MTIHQNQKNLDFTIAIMSFNRGKYLRLCALSCLKNLPDIQIIIYDDNSDDLQTIDILEELQNLGCRIVRVTETELTARHGGLYDNMQRALDECQTPWLVYLQDDVQVVRTLDKNTADVIRTQFQDPDIAFIRSQFFKESDMWRFRKHLSVAPERGVLEPIDTYKNCDIDHSYCDVMIADVAKLRAVNWQFEGLERANQHRAKQHFKYMPYLWNPFVFYCPEVPSYRDRKLYLASRIVQHKRNNEIVSYLPIEGETAKAFLERNNDRWPIAEDFLVPTLNDVRQPFVFQDYAKTWWLHALYKIESRLWRIFTGIFRVFRKK